MWKVKFSIVSKHAAQRGSRLQPYTLLISALVGGEWWRPRSDRFTSQMSSGTHSRALGGPQGVCGWVLAKKKFLASSGDAILGPPALSESLYRQPYSGHKFMLLNTKMRQINTIHICSTLPQFPGMRRKQGSKKAL